MGVVTCGFGLIVLFIFFFKVGFLTTIDGPLTVRGFFAGCGPNISMVRVFGRSLAEIGVLNKPKSTHAKSACRIRANEKAGRSDRLKVDSPS